MMLCVVIEIKQVCIRALTAIDLIVNGLEAFVDFRRSRVLFPGLCECIRRKDGPRQQAIGWCDLTGEEV